MIQGKRSSFYNRKIMNEMIFHKTTFLRTNISHCSHFLSIYLPQINHMNDINYFEHENDDVWLYVFLNHIVISSRYVTLYYIFLHKTIT